jgi:hypothetical protein
VSRKTLALFIGLGAAAAAFAQQPSQPQVKVNMLNVCSPSPEEQKEIAAALAKVPRQPLFGQDFEIDRGRSSLDAGANFLQAGQNAQMNTDSGTADWVRIRRELSVQAMFSTVQYSFSVDSKNMVETLVFRVRDPKDLLQVSIEDSAAAVTPPAVMLASNTPVSRIKLERFGKPSVVLARCSATEAGPAPDQSAFAPLFQSATTVVGTYRNLLGARHTIPDELARVKTAAPGATKMPAKHPAKTPGKN